MAFAEVDTKQLSPIVKISGSAFELKDKIGNKYFVKTDCKFTTDNITEFTIKSRKVDKGTRVKLSKNKICKVEKITTL